MKDSSANCLPRESFRSRRNKSKINPEGIASMLRQCSQNDVSDSQSKDRLIKIHSQRVTNTLRSLIEFVRKLGC